MKTQDRCCCSHCSPEGFSTWCCGPPIRHAARGACIFLLVLSLPGIIAGIAELAQSDECKKRSAENAVIAAIIINIAALIIYAWGTWVTHTGNVKQAQLLWLAHIFISCLTISVGVCVGSNYALSPRRKDASLNTFCVAECKKDPPQSIFGGNQDPCEFQARPAGGWVGAAIQTVIWAYYAYILWSFAQRARDGTMDTVGERAVMHPMAVPHSQYAQATAIAMPVAMPMATAVPMGMAMAVPVEDPKFQAPDPYSSITSPPYSQNQLPDANQAAARLYPQDNTKQSIQVFSTGANAPRM